MYFKITLHIPSVCQIKLHVQLCYKTSHKCDLRKPSNGMLCSALLSMEANGCPVPFSCLAVISPASPDTGIGMTICQSTH